MSKRPLKKVRDKLAECDRLSLADMAGRKVTQVSMMDNSFSGYVKIRLSGGYYVVVEYLHLFDAEGNRLHLDV